MSDEATPMLIPAWLGPDTLWVRGRGKAYVFGIFALSPDRVAFATEEQLVVDEARQDAVFEWPRYMFGVGLRIRTQKQSCIVAFGRPFPDAPAPDRAMVEGMAKSLESLAANVDSLNSSWGQLTGILGDAIMAAQSLTDVKKGLRTGKIVRNALESS